MNFKTSDIIEGTFLVILVSLIVKNSLGFSRVISTFGSVYVNAVTALKA